MYKRKKMIVQINSLHLGAIGTQELLIIFVILVPVVLLVLAINAFRKGYRGAKRDKY